MLIQLNIQNFAIVEQLEIDLKKGMSAITGETGAGKSIAIDALGLCLGNRVEGNIVRKGATKADLSARFLLDKNPDAVKWLEEHELDDELPKECLLRRVIGEDGRSKGFINGTPVPLSQLREIGELLIQIHGQHAHQTLLKSDNQRNLLDAYLDDTNLVKAMRSAYKTWSESCKALSQHQTLAAERLARAELLNYQLEELEDFLPVEGEYESNDEEYKRLSNSGDLLLTSQNIINFLQDDEHVNITTLLNKAKQQLQGIIRYDKKLGDILTMLEEADIQINEACEELRHHASSLEMDPQRLYELEKRLSKQLQLARKHQVTPEALPAYYAQLKQESLQFKSQQENQETLVAKIDEQYKIALSAASNLNQARRKSAQELSAKITESIRELSMPHGQFEILIAHEPEYLSAYGADKIEFVVTTNPGQPLASLAKVASGGELSRMSLAIQVITAQKMAMPALIFDEVDVGISGPTAAIVGKLLRQLGETTQVLCVTHLPQVAAAAHQHFYVNKTVEPDANQEMMTTTQMHALDHQGRLNELARLLGGTQITENTLANAKELIDSF
ncbi:DNA repair protein RecN [Thorsellia anophelis]|uniref:DNA repair protein RecN n=2 Tax=Thorsellia anophelis TaxID=336804 RepID=A0A1I0EAI8_9GAMM